MSVASWFSKYHGLYLTWQILCFFFPIFLHWDDLHFWRVSFQNVFHSAVLGWVLGVFFVYKISDFYNKKKKMGYKWLFWVSHTFYL